MTNDQMTWNKCLCAVSGLEGLDLMMLLLFPNAVQLFSIFVAELLSLNDHFS